MGAIVTGEAGELYWNAQPPNAKDGFLTFWRDALRRAGVDLETACDVRSISRAGREAGRLAVETADGARRVADAVFLAIPPPAMSRLLARCPDGIAGSLGPPLRTLGRVLEESVYSHLGITWFFDRELPRPLPLGGHNVRRGWHPILVEYPQYRPYLEPPAVTAVIGSVSIGVTQRGFLHLHHVG